MDPRQQLPTMVKVDIVSQKFKKNQPNGNGGRATSGKKRKKTYNNQLSKNRYYSNENKFHKKLTTEEIRMVAVQPSAGQCGVVRLQRQALGASMLW